MNFFDDLKMFLGSSKTSLREVLNIQEGSAVQQTVDNIYKSVDMKGSTLWILFCAALIASVGLDQNSGAVIIGAMLISPLMGPILGVGLSVGINDKAALFKSIRHLGLATGVSLLASYLYFVITPLGKMTEQLAARTEPNSLDTIVAFAGGIAGIVAGSRKEQTNAIPGVAIATALMPPVCTAGYGLATGHISVFLGAIYLFLLNAVFISTATYIIVRFLKFPFKEQVDASSQKKVKRWFFVFMALIIIPSISKLVTVVRKERLESSISSFVNVEIEQNFPKLISSKYIIDQRGDSSIVRIAIVGDVELSAERIIDLNNNLRNYYDVDNARIEIIQNKNSDETERIFETLKKEGNYIGKTAFDDTRRDLQKYKDLSLKLSEELNILKSDTIPFNSLVEEIKVHYPLVTGLRYGKVYGGEDTVLTFFVSWEEEKTEIELDEDIDKIKAWLKIRLKKDTVNVIEQ